MDDKLRLFYSVLGENRVKGDFNVSGELKAFYTATRIKELIEAVKICHDLKVECVVSGLGSKIAFSDEPFNGLIIHNRCDNIKISGIKGKVSKGGLGIDEVFLEVESGVGLIQLFNYADEQNLKGLDFFKTTLGTIGESITLYPVLEDKIYQVQVLDEGNNIIEKKLTGLKKSDIVLKVTLKLKSKK